jgi:hypothetical protein
LRTRTLHVIAACLITAGIVVAAAGLHPRVPDAAISAGGLLIILSLPAVVAAQSRRVGDVRADQIAAARNAGYRTGLLHAALGILEPTDGGTRAGSYARGHLRAVGAERPTLERTADQ